jgi:hypothetical protein
MLWGSAVKRLALVVVVLACQRSLPAPAPVPPSEAGAPEGAPQEGGVSRPKEAGPDCIDYPDVGVRVFPFDPNPAPAELPLCVPKCHPRMGYAGAGFAQLDQDLPSGPCDDEGSSCGSGLTAGRCGPCRDDSGPGNGYRCTCRGHRWQCTEVSRGAAVCHPPSCLGPTDGGVCYTTTQTATQICACGSCRTLCRTDADCPTGKCHPGQICSAPAGGCPGPDECQAECTGVCE